MGVKFFNRSLSGSTVRALWVIFIALIALLLLFPSQLFAEERVRLDGGALIFEQIIETARIENVPANLTAEQAREVVEGLVSEVVIVSSDTIMMSVIPFVEEEIVSHRTIEYKDGWVDDVRFESVIKADLGNMGWWFLPTLAMFIYTLLIFPRVTIHVAGVLILTTMISTLIKASGYVSGELYVAWTVFSLFVPLSYLAILWLRDRSQSRLDPHFVAAGCTVIFFVQKNIMINTWVDNMPIFTYTGIICLIAALASMTFIILQRRVPLRV